MANKKFVILGAGGLARELYTYFWDQEPVAYYTEQRQFVHAYNIPNITSLENYSNMLYVCGVGDPVLKQKLITQAEQQGLKPNAPLVHKSGYMSFGNTILDGVVVAPMCSVSTNVTIGYNTYINLQCTIGHDTEIGDMCQINPGVNISGNVSIGDKVLIGTGACIREGVSIGDGAVIGMGAVVVKDVAPGSTVMGNPAKPRS